MKLVARGLFLTTAALASCHTAHDVAVTSYHVATAPVRYVRRAINPDRPPSTTTTTTTTTESDVTTPGGPVPAATPQRRPSSAQASRTEPSRATRKKSAEAKPKASPPQPASSQPSFPTAKAVPDKPGYVFSPSDPGKYVDVTGYAPGSKVKDPYSGQIFLVP